jgi:hypothetical protein
MKYRQETRAERDWDGEFDTMMNGQDLGRNPVPKCTFRDAQDRRCITQQDFAQVAEDGAFPVTFFWNTSET